MIRCLSLYSCESCLRAVEGTSEGPRPQQPGLSIPAACTGCAIIYGSTAVNLSCCTVQEAALSAPVSASKSARDRDDAATPGATKPIASAQTTPARMQAGGSQQPVSSLRRSRRLPWEGTLTKEAARLHCCWLEPPAWFWCSHVAVGQA